MKRLHFEQDFAKRGWQMMIVAAEVILFSRFELE
jgi:hypothetical protein